MRRRWLLGLALALLLPAQMRMSVAQLTAFLRSSVDLKHDDRRVAAYLKKVSLTEKLDARTLEDLQGYGIGPKTVEALEELREASKSLPPPKPVAVMPAPSPIPAPPPAEQKRVIEAAREYALNYSKRLPDFICTQVTRRYVDPAGLEFWQQMDTITARLSYFEQKENYQVVLVNNRPVDLGYNELGGAISSGEFGSMLKELFDPETSAEFAWERWSTLRGRRMHVYRYRVSQSRSKWRISYQRALDIIAGYRGLVFVDAETQSVARIRLEADGLPPSFPIQQASVELDYDGIQISGVHFMLPLKHTMRMREAKMLVKNEVEFRMYRKFGAEAVITFDTPDPLPEEVTQEKPVQPPPRQP
ncbi:MAG: hypothetical protein FJW20_11460 [Acidimicrobiia bacterium]|nr:hypothetical protein [Acidimicrobiia bacterium]